MNSQWMGQQEHSFVAKCSLTAISGTQHADDDSICIIDQKMLTPSPTNMRRFPQAQHHFQEWMSLLKKSRVPLPTGKKLLESSMLVSTGLLIFEEVISYRRIIQDCSKYNYWAKAICVGYLLSYLSHHPSFCHSLGWSVFITLLCTQLTNTKHICVSGGKMEQDVGMVWKCCSVIPI